ncbi:HTH-type transcriptional repressor SmtB [Corynebacterium glaucum]|uniref:HTH-type transcriptional repressor SmtB n=1 Tax=Corynebacterium glaucum TaxID=187491 RepID=A0A1Q2HY99_9CORY|nr:metalloregulator ArsR/SmtB family transcription factor [Corynebacterium glaucum]AQQ15821.1 HTH-type transcriptional repressor SmtB [Corynebacterium glaucum]
MRDPGSLAPRELELVAELLGALDSQLRLRILFLLHTGDHVVHELVTKLGKSQPLISQHLRVLKCVGLVESRRAGREVIYSLAQPAIIDIIVELSTVAGTGELDHRRSTKESSRRKPAAAMPGGGIVAVNEPPPGIRPDKDPGLTPSTARPKKD